MRVYIAFYYEKIPYETKNYYLEIIKNNTFNNKKQKINEQQPKVYEKFELTKIDFTKINMANHAIIKFFAYCNIPFHIVKNPFLLISYVYYIQNAFSQVEIPFQWLCLIQNWLL